MIQVSGQINTPMRQRPPDQCPHCGTASPPPLKKTAAHKESVNDHPIGINIGLLRERLEQALEQIEILKRELGLQEQFPSHLRLTASENIVLGALLKRRSVSRQSMLTYLYHDTDRQPGINVVSVFIGKIRDKLSRFGISIHNAWRQGWYITDEDKAKIRGLMGCL
jgi:hypothetical protein